MASKKKARAKVKPAQAVAPPTAPPVARERGAPSKYHERYPALLEEHMGKGFSFKSFGAVTDPHVSERTLYQWVEDHPDFSQAKDIGEALMERYYIANAQMMANGQIKVPVRSTPVIDGNGKPVMDPKNPGRVLLRVDYEVAKVNPVVQCFLMRNLLKWSEKNEVTHRGDKDNPVHVRQTRVLDASERLQEIELLRARRLELGCD